MSRIAVPTARSAPVRPADQISTEERAGAGSDSSEAELGLIGRFLAAVPWLLGSYVALMFMATHMPAAHIPKSLPGSDKHWHFLAYFGLGVMLAVWGRSRPSNWPWVCLGIAAAYGIADELLQIPFGRTADLHDWFADLAGAASGVAVVAILANTGVAARLRWTRAS